MESYLRCGILAHGFVRVWCPTCKDDLLVGFSCQGRGICPSCGGRRMTDTAARWVDRVLPGVPWRQWVLRVPFELRLWMAWDAYRSDKTDWTKPLSRQPGASPPDPPAFRDGVPL